jgi:hypothetical protein
MESSRTASTIWLTVRSTKGVGMTIRRISPKDATWRMSPEARRFSGSGYPLRYVLFSCSSLTWRTTSGSSAHSSTSWPMRAACSASAVPHAPPPSTPMLVRSLLRPVLRLRSAPLPAAAMVGSGDVSDASGSLQGGTGQAVKDACWGRTAANTWQARSYQELCSLPDWRATAAQPRCRNGCRCSKATQTCRQH